MDSGLLTKDFGLSIIILKNNDYSPQSMSVGRNVGADVALLEAVAGLLVRLRDVDCPLRDAPEQLTADVTLVAELLVQKSLFVTVPVKWKYKVLLDSQSTLPRLQALKSNKELRTKLGPKMNYLFPQDGRLKNIQLENVLHENLFRLMAMFSQKGLRL